jgi:hypothetical protein
VNETSVTTAAIKPDNTKLNKNRPKNIILLSLKELCFLATICPINQAEIKKIIHIFGELNGS